MKGDIQSLEEQYDGIVKELNLELLKMPNTALHPDVPIGKDETENVVAKVVGEVPSFDFEPKDHIVLMKQHDMVDIER